MSSAFSTTVSVVFVVLLSTADLAAREGKFFSAQINYLIAGVEGSGRTAGDLATEFALDDTFGINEDDEVPEANLWFSFGNNSILLAYYRSRYDGRNVLGDDLVFEGTTFPSGSEVDSEFEFALARLHYNYRFFDTKLVDFGLLVGADLFSGQGDVTGAAGSLQDGTDFNAPFPVLGFNLAVKPPGGLRVYLEASGMVADVGDVDGSALDAQARLTWYIMDGPFGVSAGYRFLDVDVDVTEEGEGDLQQSGYYGGISLRF